MGITIRLEEEKDYRNVENLIRDAFWNVYRPGFIPSKSKGIRYADDPEADYLLCLELKKGYLDGIDGTWTDPSGYFVCEKNPEGFEKFEAGFPYKEKKKLPGQLFG